MPDLTRRDALLVTAAVAAIAPTLQQAEAADPPDPIILVPQSSPISDGSAIPISIHLTANWFERQTIDLANLTSLAVTLSRSVDTPAVFKPFATFTLSANALAGAKAKSDVEFATRIKQLVEANKPPVELKLQASIKVNGTTDYDGGTAMLTVARGDCQPANTSLLRVSAQPPSVAANKDIDLRAIVPQPLASGAHATPRKLTKIACKFRAKDAHGAYDDGTPCIVVDGVDDTYLADEVFVQVRLRTPASGIVDFEWSYDDSSTINGSIFATVTA